MGETNNSLAKGILGAVLGSVPGIILWIIVGYFGYTAAIVGMVVAFGIVIGYDKFGGPAGNAGLITCILVMVLAIYLGVHLTWSVSLMSIHPNLMKTIFSLYSYLWKYNILLDFFKSLGLGYVFGLIGAVSVISKAVR